MILYENTSCSANAIAFNFLVAVQIISYEFFFREEKNNQLYNPINEFTCTYLCP